MDSKESENNIVEREFGFVEALKVADRVFEKYKAEQPAWWGKMDGSPILHDVAVRMAESFLDEIRCQFLCGVHGALDKSGKLKAFDNCLACIQNENLELRQDLDDANRKLAPSPCGKPGHRMVDWVVCNQCEGYRVIEGIDCASCNKRGMTCLACLEREAIAAAERERCAAICDAKASYAIDKAAGRDKLSGELLAQLAGIMKDTAAAIRGKRRPKE